MRRAALLLLALATAAPAHAADPAPCPPVIAANHLQLQSRAAAAFFLDADIASAGKVLNDGLLQLRCQEDPVEPGALADFARTVALLHFYQQEEAKAVQWALLGRTAAPDRPWPEDIPEDHALRALVDDKETPPIGGPEGKVLAPPGKGVVFLDGRLLLEPRAVAEVPHFVQLFDRGGHLVEAWWQEGAVFPPGLLQDGKKGPKPPKWARELQAERGE